MEIRFFVFSLHAFQFSKRNEAKHDKCILFSEIKAKQHSLEKIFNSRKDGTLFLYISNQVAKGLSLKVV